MLWIPSTLPKSNLIPSNARSKIRIHLIIDLNAMSWT